MDYYWAFLLTLFITVIVTLFLSFFKMWNKSILILILMLILLANLRHLLKFSISITIDKIVVKKQFIFIPYLTIIQNFDKVIYNEKVPILYFQNKHERVEIENFEGFEVDCLLIRADNKEYEFGDKNDADLIFKFLVAGLDELKVEKTIADIGYVGRT
jgi:hypothetical protein